MGSRYIIESGFYMTPLTATIFVGALATVGVLLITLLVSLTVMLQYCQNRSEGVVEIQRSSVDYDYCKALSVHLELNSLETDGIPSFCKDFAIQYIRTGQYERDLDSSLLVVENYFCSAAKVDNGQDIVLMDIDDLFFTNGDYNDVLISRYVPDICMVFFLSLLSLIIIIIGHDNAKFRFSLLLVLFPLASYFIFIIPFHLEIRFSMEFTFNHEKCKNIMCVNINI